MCITSFESLILLHGANGRKKTQLVQCVQRYKPLDWFSSACLCSPSLLAVMATYSSDCKRQWETEGQVPIPKISRVPEQSRLQRGQRLDIKPKFDQVVAYWIVQQGDTIWECVTLVASSPALHPTSLSPAESKNMPEERRKGNPEDHSTSEACQLPPRSLCILGQNTCVRLKVKFFHTRS